MHRITLAAALASIAAVGFAAPTQAALLDFNSLVHGEITNTQFFASHGVTISADNFSTGLDLAVAFDTELTSQHPDFDLLRDPHPNDENRDQWKNGNLDLDTVMGMALIIPENGAIDGDGDQIIDNPNDEGAQPAGYIRFEFNTDLLSAGFDVIDFEEFQTTSVSAYDNGGLVGTINFGDFIARDGAVFGDATINRIGALSASDFAGGATHFDRLDFNFGGSGAVDNLVYRQVVPEPASMLLLGVGLAGAGAIRRRRSQR